MLRDVEGSYGSSFCEDLPYCVHRGCTDFRSHQQCTGFPFSTSLQTPFVFCLFFSFFLSPVFLMTAILTGVKWCPLVVCIALSRTICIVLMTSDIGHHKCGSESLFCCLQTVHQAPYWTSETLCPRLCLWHRDNTTCLPGVCKGCVDVKHTEGSWVTAGQAPLSPRCLPSRSVRPLRGKAYLYVLHHRGLSTFCSGIS